MTREWAHIKLLKRCGRGHDPLGRAGTCLGQAAVLCPACPHPGKNLPEDWERAPDDIRYEYNNYVVDHSTHSLYKI